jgi:hypothetical protein
MLALALLLAACGTGALPDAVAMPPGSRQWIINVDNQSGQDAHLLVASDAGQPGEQVGNATPAIVPPRTKRDVVFSVPPGEAWAIFVSPMAERALLTAADVPPDVAGRLPISIVIEPSGDGFVSLPGDLPGWFGR